MSAHSHGEAPRYEPRLRPSEGMFSLPFSLPALDRAERRRKEPEWLARAQRAEDTAVLVLRDGATVPIGADGALHWRSPAEVRGERGEWILLGIDPSGRVLFASALAGESEEEMRYEALREVGPALAAAEAEAAIQAVALHTWHTHHRHCANCGAVTEPADAGHTRRCRDCGTQHFPRTDPAVIMLVSDGERCVLGRRVGAPEGRWSTLAGFVEPGETPEAAVAREVYEEVGLEVSAVRYRGAQPWPFPASLMLAFEADAEHKDLAINDEHHEVRWFTREELAEGVASQTMTLPGEISAGHALLQRWLGEGH